MLANCVETYWRLDDDEQQRFEQIVGAPVDEEVTQMLSVYEERGIAEGALQSRREAASRRLRHKFGQLPPAVRASVEAMESVPELDALSATVLDATSLEQLGAAGNGSNGHAE